MKTILILFFLNSFFFSFSQKSKGRLKKYTIKQIENSRKPVLDIFFGGGFDNDTISLKTASFKIFDKLILTNFRIVDHTNFIVKIYMLDSNEIGAIYSGSTQFGTDNIGKLRTGKANTENDIFNLSISLNGSEKVYPLNFRNGTYIDFSKSNDSLKYVQRNKRILYD